MIVLFWDIDGTLLTTGKAGVPAWEQAVREIVQRDFQLSSFRVAGLTDYQIAVRTFEMLDFPADETTIRRMVASASSSVLASRIAEKSSSPQAASVRTGIEAGCSVPP